MRRARARSCSSPTSPEGCGTTGPTWCGPWPTPGPTPSRSASRSPTPSWTGPSSRPPPSRRSPRARRPRRSSTELRAHRRRGAAGRHDLLQPRVPGRPRALRRTSLADGRGGRGHPPRPPARRGRPVGRRGRRRRGRDGACSPRPPRPTSACRASRPEPGASSTPSASSGVTGERDALAASALGHRRPGARRSPTSRCWSGSGVAPPQQAVEVSEVADGVVVGSALVRRVLEGAGPDGRRRPSSAEVRAALDA